MWRPFLLTLQLLCVMVFVLLAVAFFSLFERKLMGLVQNRKGPNKVGMGVLQPIADAMKLVSKVESSSHSAPNFIFFISPLVLFFFSVLFWVALPSKWILINWSSSCFLFLSLFSVSVFGLIMSGWYSNSKYATLGGCRAFVQSISYEVGLTLAISFLCIYISSPSLFSFLLLQEEEVIIIPLFSFFVFLTSIMLAELNRSPFDLSEGESELVSGYSVEFGGLSYTLLFLGENLSLIWSSVMISLFFNSFFIGIMVIFFVWIRATVPRIRFDMMVNLFWVIVLPLLLAFSSFYLSIN